MNTRRATIYKVNSLLPASGAAPLYKALKLNLLGQSMFVLFAVWLGAELKSAVVAMYPTDGSAPSMAQPIYSLGEISMISTAETSTYPPLY